MGFRDRKETDVLQLIYSVSLIAIGIPEDEHDDEDEDDSKFRNLGLREQLGEVCQGIEHTIGTDGRVLQLVRPELSGTNQDSGTTRG